MGKQTTSTSETHTESAGDQSDEVRIERLEDGDTSRVMQASHLFDHPVKEDATTRFLTEPNHHLLIAYVDDTPVGFVSGVEITHPDKETDMFLYELGVDDNYRRRGFGRTLVRSLADLGSELGCKEMFVLTEDDNPAALATYRSAGAAREGDRPVMLEWQLSPQAHNDGEEHD